MIIITQKNATNGIWRPYTRPSFVTFGESHQFRMAPFFRFLLYQEQCSFMSKRKSTADSSNPRKRSKNHGVWSAMSPSTQQRYLIDVPSPDPLLRQLELNAAVQRSAHTLSTCTLSPIAQQPSPAPVPSPQQTSSPAADNGVPSKEPKVEEIPAKPCGI